MKTIQSFIAVTVIVIIAFGSCSSSLEDGKKDIAAATGPSEPQKTILMPAFKMTDVNGNIIDLLSLKGKKVFVNLWATWCPPCRAEMPSIEKLYSTIDKGKVVFVMLSLDETFDKAKRFVKAKNMQAPVYYPAGNLPAMFNTGGIPATFIFNEKSELIKVNNGMEDYDTEEYRLLLKP